MIHLHEENNLNSIVKTVYQENISILLSVYFLRTHGFKQHFSHPLITFIDIYLFIYIQKEPSVFRINYLSRSVTTTESQ